MLEKLYSDLKKFGLNPDEWIIEFKDKKFQKAVIRNIQDNSYSYSGSARVKKYDKSLVASWSAIQIASL